MNSYCLSALAISLVLAGCGGGTQHKENVAAASLPAKAPDPSNVSLPQGSPKLSQLRIAEVQMADVPADEVTSPGKVEANPNRMAHVVLPVAGRVTSVTAKIGEAVRQGQPVVAVESPDVDVAISGYLQAEAALTQAKAGEAKAQADLDRTRDLFEHNAVAKKEVLNGEALLTQTKAGVEQAHAALEQSRRKLQILGIQPGQFGQRVSVNAPISGKVLEMNVVPGEYRNDTSSPLMTIADLSTVWVSADVPETSIRHVQVGERIDVEFAAYPDETFRGRVTQIADTVDPQTRTIKVRAELDNHQGRLRPEMFGRIRHSDTTEKRPVVPAVAVDREQDQDVVWRQVSPGNFQRTAIKTGSRIGDRVVVLSGLNPGDQIVTDGVMLLKGN